MTKICSRSRATEIILPCDMLAAMLQYVRCSDNNHKIRERTAYMERKQIEFVTHPQESRVEWGHTRTGDSLRSRLLIEAVWSIVTAAAIME